MGCGQDVEHSSVAKIDILRGHGPQLRPTGAALAAGQPLAPEPPPRGDVFLPLPKVQIDPLKKDLAEALSRRQLQRAIDAFEQLRYAPDGDPDFESPAFNHDGILIPEAAVAQLPPGPFSDYRIRARNSRVRQIVSRLANRFQLYYARTEELAEQTPEEVFYFVAGVGLLKAGDAAADEDRLEALGTLKLASDFLDILYEADKKSQVSDKPHIWNWTATARDFTRLHVEMWANHPAVRFLNPHVTDAAFDWLLAGASIRFGQEMSLKSLIPRFEKHVRAMAPVDRAHTTARMAEPYKAALLALASSDIVAASQNAAFYDRAIVSLDPVVKSEASALAFTAIHSPEILRLDQAPVDSSFDITHMSSLPGQINLNLELSRDKDFVAIFDPASTGLQFLSPQSLTDPTTGRLLTAEELKTKLGLRVAPTMVVDVTFYRQTRLVRTVLASGGVVFTLQDKASRSGRAKFGDVRELE